jgi:hypothetical protein
MPTLSAGRQQGAAVHAEFQPVPGFTSVVGILVGTVISSAIFVAPNRIAELAGSPQPILAGVPAVLSRRRRPGRRSA